MTQITLQLWSLAVALFSLSLVACVLRIQVKVATQAHCCLLTLAPGGCDWASPALRCFPWAPPHLLLTSEPLPWPQCPSWTYQVPFINPAFSHLSGAKQLTGCSLVLLDCRRLERSLQPSFCHGSSFPRASQEALVAKNLPANAGVVRTQVWSMVQDDSPGGEGIASHSCLENPMDRGAWWATVHRVTKSWTRPKWLSAYTYLPLF